MSSRETRASIETENRIYAREQLIKQIQAPLLSKISELERRIKALEIDSFLKKRHWQGP